MPGRLLPKSPGPPQDSTPLSLGSLSPSDDSQEVPPRHDQCLKRGPGMAVAASRRPDAQQHSDTKNRLKGKSEKGGGLALSSACLWPLIRRGRGEREREREKKKYIYIYIYYTCPLGHPPGPCAHRTPTSSLESGSLYFQKIKPKASPACLQRLPPFPGTKRKKYPIHQEKERWGGGR